MLHVLELVLAALTLASALSTAYFAWRCSLFEGRVQTLERERAGFVLEVEKLLEQCSDVLDRADQKRRRAAAAEQRALAREGGGQAPDPLVVPSLPADRAEARRVLSEWRRRASS